MSSGTIFRKSIANKSGLSAALDTTLKNSHDMRVFGLGAVAEFTTDKYKHFAIQRYHFYSAMERRFDDAKHGGISKVWPKFAGALRQTPCLISDLKEIKVDDPESIPPTLATIAYCERIERCSNDSLIGHFYCRYFADLFGGSMLGHPTSLALSIPFPSFYTFPSHVLDDRAAYIEKIYESINESGVEMGELSSAEVVEEAKAAFHHNAAIITEQGVGLVPYIAGGIFNVSTGYLRKRMTNM
jgi:heme oxygenase